jgi:hypothetical protein
MYFFLPNITDPICIKYLREVVLPRIQNVVGILKQITILLDLGYVLSNEQGNNSLQNKKLNII